MALKYPDLFQPFYIGKLCVKNRICMSGMHNIGWTDGHDVIDDKVIDYFEERAKGGVGLIFTGAVQPDFQFDDYPTMANPFQTPGTFISQHKKLADRVHSYGTKLFIQLGYGGGRVGWPRSVPKGRGVAADSLANRWDPEIEHRPLTSEEIRRIIDASVSAASVCKKSGCDGVDINCYAGYLLDQFLQPCYNKRTDEYGGLDGGIKIMSDIVRGIKEACGKSFPVSCRIGTRQHIKAPRKGGLDGENYTEYGRTPEESLYVAKKLEEAGYDALYIGNGSYDSFYWLYPPMYQKEGLWLDDVAKLTEQASVPVLCGGKILQPDMANEAVRSGKVDAVVIGRGLLADPDWCNKARLGEDEAIRPCIGCNFGCIGHIFNGLPQLCAVNASLFREKEYAITKAETPKRVAVIGGGVAGMECARAAAARGHEVTLYEKSDRLGGTFLAASVQRSKDAERRLLKWFERELDKNGVKVEFNCTMNLAAVEKLNADEIVVSTGNTPKELPIPGLKQENVLGAVDVLLGKQTVNGEKIAVIGGGLVGCEVAIWLAEEQGKKDITLIEGASKLMADGYEPMPLPNRLMLEDMLEYYGVDVKLSSFLKKVDGNNVIIAANGAESSIEADTVILAMGFDPNNSLYREVYSNVPKKVWCLGDAQTPSNIMFGIRDANSVARQI